LIGERRNEKDSKGSVKIRW